MVEFRPGAPTAIFAKLQNDIVVKGRIALAPLADGIVAKAKEYASQGSHRPHTPTPSPGNPLGPAVISGTLKRSIDRTPVVRTPVGWLCQVGIRPGVTPSSYNNGPEMSSVYAYILEVIGAGRTRHRFPFLYPAAEYGFIVLAPTIYQKMYGSDWTRLA
jgi:hypothetical protein